MEYVLYAVLALVVIFLAVVLIRTAMFVPKKEEERKIEKVEFDADAAILALQELVRCKTVSFYDHSKEDDAEFEKLISLLPKLYPNVVKTCEFQRFPDRGLLFKWKGTEETKEAAVLMAHYDVVPIEESLWTKPAFDALIEDGILWGRGTLDTKNTLNGILSAAENLIKQGFAPKQDVYFAFSGGEEVSGKGAIHIVDYFHENGIKLSMVVDEGGAVCDKIFPGVKESVGMVGIAEKGLMNLELSVSSNGGHASSPAPHTPVGILSAACVKMENHPFKKHFTKPVLAMFDTLGRRSTFVYRMIFANLWCFGGLLDGICKKSGGELNALVRTTEAFTQAFGSKAPNVIPPTASMVVNMRLNPEDTVDSAVEYVTKVVGDERVKIRVMEGENPSPVSRLDVPSWSIVKNAVADTWGCVVSPYLMVQCSDSRHYGPISDKVYRFSAADMTVDERHSIHGNDEHIRLETVRRAVEFFIRVLKEC